jgi:hypothetical protein
MVASAQSTIYTLFRSGTDNQEKSMTTLGNVGDVGVSFITDSVIYGQHYAFDMENHIFYYIDTANVNVKGFTWDSSVDVFDFSLVGHTPMALAMDVKSDNTRRQLIIVTNNNDEYYNLVFVALNSLGGAENHTIAPLNLGSTSDTLIDRPAVNSYGGKVYVATSNATGIITLFCYSTVGSFDRESAVVITFIYPLESLSYLEYHVTQQVLYGVVLDDTFAPFMGFFNATDYTKLGQAGNMYESFSHVVNYDTNEIYVLSSNGGVSYLTKLPMYCYENATYGYSDLITLGPVFDPVSALFIRYDNNLTCNDVPNAPCILNSTCTLDLQCASGTYCDLGSCHVPRVPVLDMLPPAIKYITRDNIDVVPENVLFNLTITDGPTNMNALLVTNGTNNIVVSFLGDDVTGKYSWFVPIYNSGFVCIMNDTVDNLGTGEFRRTNVGDTCVQIIWDPVPPTLVSIAAKNTSDTNVSPIEFIIEFDEAVVGFTSTNLNLTSCTFVSFTATTDRIFSVLVASSVTYGNVGVAIGADLVTDSAGNKNAANTTVASVFFDSIAPTVVSINTTVVSPMNYTLIPLGISFDEAVTFRPSMLTLVNCILTSSSSPVFGTLYVDVVVTALVEGPVSVTVPAGCITDSAGNANTVTALISFTYDITFTAPVVSFTAGDFTNVNPVAVITFTEAPISLLPNQLHYFGCTPISGTDWDLGTTATTFIVSVLPTGTLLREVNVSVLVPAQVCKDVAGNNNPASNVALIKYDTVLPVPTMTVSTTLTNQFPIDFALSWSEELSIFRPSFVSVVGGVADITQGAIGFGVISVTPSDSTIETDHNVTVTIVANSAEDMASNNNTVTVTRKVRYDTLKPTVSIDAPTHASNDFDITVTFSEPVVSFSSDNVTIVGAAVVVSESFGLGSVFTVRINATEPCAISSGCNITLTVAADMTMDEASNTNKATVVDVIVVYDMLLPVLVSVTNTSDYFNKTSVSPVEYVITFNEPVVLDVGMLNVTNGDITNVAPAASVFSSVHTVTVTPKNTTSTLVIEEVIMEVLVGLGKDRANHTSLGTFYSVLNFDFCALHGGELDCNNDCNGTAVLDAACGSVCAAGKTGVVVGACKTSESFLTSTVGMAAIGGSILLIGGAFIAICKSSKSKKPVKQRSFMDDIAAVGLSFDGVESLSNSHELVISESSSNSTTNDELNLRTLVVDSLDMSFDGQSDSMSNSRGNFTMPAPSATADDRLSEIESIDVL